MALIFANATLEPLWVAYMFWSPQRCRGLGDWQAIGWFYVPPMRRAPPKHGGGKKGDLLPSPITTTVYGNSLKDVNNRYWCYYAENGDGSVFWAGPYPVFLSDAAFNHCYHEGRSDWRKVGFRLFDVGNSDNAIITLTD